MNYVAMFKISEILEHKRRKLKTLGGGKNANDNFNSSIYYAYDLGECS